mgnify:CR=1 FL=1
MYGHPDAGGWWERHADEKARIEGFVPIENWPSVYWHDGLEVVLIIYVDDFKLSGPEDKLQLGWDLISKGLNIEPPAKLGLYLGCKHEESVRILPDTGKSVRVMEYNMEDFLRSCVDRYRELTGVHYMRQAATPFLAEPTGPDFTDGPNTVTNEEVKAAEEALERAASSQATQTLKPYAAKVLMKVLYAARYARFDLLRAVCYLAQFITKWDQDCDKRLYRLMCYIHSTYHLRLSGWVGDDRDHVTPHLFVDADFCR